VHSQSRSTHEDEDSRDPSQPEQPEQRERSRSRLSRGHSLSVRAPSPPLLEGLEPLGPDEVWPDFSKVLLEERRSRSDEPRAFSASAPLDDFVIRALKVVARSRRIRGRIEPSPMYWVARSETGFGSLPSPPPPPLPRPASPRIHVRRGSLSRTRYAYYR